METKTGKTVFVEYSSANKGQHFMTVVQTIDHKRIIIGRIFREYNQETKKAKYRATDFAGNQVFADDKDLYSLKKHFIENGKNLADMSRMAQRSNVRKEKQSFPPKVERNDAVKKTRVKKTTKEKTKVEEKQNPNSKEINSERNKDLEQVREKGQSKENNQEKEEPEPENQIQDEQSNEQENEISDRENELDEIREEDNDREQEMEIDR
jgi:hypothetical protein